MIVEAEEYEYLTIRMGAKPIHYPDYLKGGLVSLV